MTTPSRVTRAGSRARSETAEPVVPISARRGGRAVRKSLAGAGAIDKPAISNKDSKAYGSSGKIAAPVQVETSEVFRSAGDRFKDALEEAQSSSGHVLSSVEEDDSPAHVQSQIDSQIHRDLSLTNSRVTSRAHSFVDEDEETANDHTLQSTAFSTWAPRGVLDRRAIDEPNTEENADFWPTLLRTLTSWTVRIYTNVIQVYHKLRSLIKDLAAQLILIASNPFLRLIGVCVIVFLILDITSGPILAERHDFSLLRRVRLDRAGTDGSPKVAYSDYRLQSIDQRVNDMSTRLRNLEIRGSKTQTPECLPVSGIFGVHGINWFEPGQGARIVTRLTSPTLAVSSVSWSSFFRDRFRLRKLAHIPMAGTGIEALQKWDDGGLDRWCSPQSRGKMQVVVQTAREILPDVLVVEHITAPRSISVGDAPREFELWAEVAEPTIREEIHKIISETEPDLHQASSPQNDRELDPGSSLTAEFVPLGRWTFDARSDQEKQVFRSALPLEHLGLYSRRFAIRVNSNWGSLDSTCVNRLRLYGKDQSGIKENLEPDIKL